MDLNVDFDDGMTENEDGTVTLTAEAAQKIGAWCLRAAATIAAQTAVIDLAAREVERHVGIAKALDRASDYLVLHTDEEDAQETANDIRSILHEYGWTSK